GSLAVKTASGRTATLTTSAATITGNLGSALHTVSMANNSTLSGMTVNTTDTTGNNAEAVQASGVSGAKVIGNTINATETGASGTAHGVDVLFGASNVLVSGNTINAHCSGVAGIALGVQVFGSSATVTGNSFNSSGAVSRNATTTLSSANVLPGSNKNVVVAGTCDVVDDGTGSTVNFTNASSCGP